MARTAFLEYACFCPSVLQTRDFCFKRSGCVLVYVLVWSAGRCHAAACSRSNHEPARAGVEGSRLVFNAFYVEAMVVQCSLVDRLHSTASSIPQCEQTPIEQESAIAHWQYHASWVRNATSPLRPHPVARPSPPSGRLARSFLSRCIFAMGV